MRTRTRVATAVAGVIAIAAVLLATPRVAPAGQAGGTAGTVYRVASSGGRGSSAYP